MGAPTVHPEVGDEAPTRLELDRLGLDAMHRR